MIKTHAGRRRNDKRRRKTSLTIFLPLTLFIRFRKGCSRFACERELETEHNWKNFDPEVMAVSVVSFSFSMAAQPEHWSPLCWVLAFLTTSRPSPSPTFSPELNCTQLHCPQLFNSSALYYLQTPTRWYGHASTPPQFLPISGDRDVSLPLPLEWPVWSSSSGNNCHAVQGSLSSGGSVYESIMGFFLPRPISSANFRPRDFLS